MTNSAPFGVAVTVRTLDAVPITHLYPLSAQTEQERQDLLEGLKERLANDLTNPVLELERPEVIYRSENITSIAIVVGQAGEDFTNILYPPPPPPIGLVRNP